MKRLRVLFSVLIVVLLPTLLINCFDPIPAGLETTIRGQLEDSVKQQKIAGAKVIIRGCYLSLMRGKDCGRIIDSVRTDRQGRFNLFFITEGGASHYEVSAEWNESVIYPSKEEVTAGRRNFLSLQARELNHIRIHVRIEGDLAYPIIVQTIGSAAHVLKTTRDTVLYRRVLPMSENQIVFSTYDTAIRASRRSVDIINIDLRDTTHFTKTISDPTKWEQGM